MNPYLQRLTKGLYKFFTNKNERKFLSLSLRYGNVKRYKKVKINFLNHKFDVPDTLSFIWQFKEIFVEEYYKFENKVGKPLIFDCGANVGTSCAFFRYQYPDSRIIAFEANPSLIEYLKKNVSNNSLRDIQVVDKAVWIDNNGLELGLENADGSSIYLNKNKSRVESIRLKDYLMQEERIEMLKMDIEGAEVEVLLDCKEELVKVRNLFVEYHSYRNERQRLSELINLLESSDFRYFIAQPEARAIPFINRTNKFNPEIDLQLNIFAYKVD